ncbi:hypothetical protein EXT49_21070 [Pectobacterium polaris]|nr:hypothetical protein [Pectobacterium polaris]
MTVQFIRFPGLPAGAFWRYSFAAAAKSVAGIGVPEITKATPHAPCVFFYVDVLVHLYVVQRILSRFSIRTMVAQAGASSEAPVSFVTGYANPVWATTLEIGVSGGSCNQLTKEYVSWLRPLPRHTRNLPFCFWPCAAPNYAPYRTAKLLSPRMKSAPAVCWRVTMCCRLLAVCRCGVHAMFDDTPLTPEELTDQCRALTHAVIELDNPMAKEVLLFVLAERLEVLSSTLDTPDHIDDLSDVDYTDTTLH